MTTMTDDTLVVDFDAMRHASAEIQQALGRLHGKLDELEAHAAPLVSTWTGTAQEAYRERQTRWRRAADDLSAILAQIKKALDESASDYHSTETRNTGLFQAR
jgi:WXG100 family type VII secretion target